MAYDAKAAELKRAQDRIAELKQRGYGSHSYGGGAQNNEIFKSGIDAFKSSGLESWEENGQLAFGYRTPPAPKPAPAPSPAPPPAPPPEVAGLPGGTALPSVEALSEAAGPVGGKVGGESAALAESPALSALAGATGGGGLSPGDLGSSGGSALRQMTRRMPPQDNMALAALGRRVY